MINYASKKLGTNQKVPKKNCTEYYYVHKIPRFPFYRKWWSNRKVSPSHCVSSRFISHNLWLMILIVLFTITRQRPIWQLKLCHDHSSAFGFQKLSIYCTTIQRYEFWPLFIFITKYVSKRGFMLYSSLIRQNNLTKPVAVVPSCTM
jgi:hypothetical protein